jgi:hypothetical protein
MGSYTADARDGCYTEVMQRDETFVASDANKKFNGWPFE